MHSFLLYLFAPHMPFGPRRKEDALNMGELAKDLTQEVGGLISQALSKTGGMAEYQAELKRLRQEEVEETRMSRSLDQGLEAPPEIRKEELRWSKHFLDYFNSYLDKMAKSGQNDFKPWDDLQMEYEAKFAQFMNETLDELGPKSKSFPSVQKMHEMFIRRESQGARRSTPEMESNPVELMQEEVNSEKRFLEYFTLHLDQMREMGSSAFKGWEELRKEHQAKFTHFIDQTLTNLGPQPQSFPSIEEMHRAFLETEKAGEELDSALLQEEPRVRKSAVKKSRAA